MGGWFIVTVVVITFVMIFGVFLRLVPFPIVGAHFLSIIAWSFSPESQVLRYALFIPLDSLLIICLFLNHYPRYIQTWSKLLLLSCAGYVLWQISPQILDLDLRPPESFAPANAKLFWEEHALYQSTDPILVKDGSRSIYWSGPTFSEFPVKIILK